MLLKVLLKGDKAENSFDYFLGMVMVSVFFLPQSQLISVRLIFFTFIFSLFIKKNVAKGFERSFDVFIFLSVLILGLTYTRELTFGLRVLETSFSLIAIPLILFKIKNYNKAKLYQIFYAFTIGVVFASIICLADAVMSYIRLRDIHVFFYDRFTDVINSHPTYLAYYVIASITFGLYLLYYEDLRFSKRWIVVVLVFLFLVLMLTGGLTAYISMLLVFSYFVLKFLLEDKTPRHTLTFVVVFCMILFMFLFHYLQDNFLNKRVDDYWERFILWESALKATSNILFGVGTGDYKFVLNQYYLTHNLSQFADKSFNAHNQFIQTFFANGLIGLIALIIMLIRPIYLSVRNQNILGILILFPFLIYGMTEVFLGRYQGVVFFALMHQAFIQLYANQPSPFALKES